MSVAYKVLEVCLGVTGVLIIITAVLSFIVSLIIYKEEQSKPDSVKEP